MQWLLLPLADEVRTNDRLKQEEDEETAEGLKPADLKVPQLPPAV